MLAEEQELVGEVEPQVEVQLRSELNVAANFASCQAIFQLVQCFI